MSTPSPAPLEEGSTSGTGVELTPTRKAPPPPVAVSTSGAELDAVLADKVLNRVLLALERFGISAADPQGSAASASADSKGKQPAVVDAGFSFNPPVHRVSAGPALTEQAPTDVQPADLQPPSQRNEIRRRTVDLENYDYLPVSFYGSRSADGFRIQPHLNADDKPHRFLIESDETYKRIVDSFKGRNISHRDNSVLQEYHGLYVNTFYLSCVQEALTAVLDAGVSYTADDSIVIDVAQLDALCQAAKTLREVESSFRDRLAGIRLKYDPDKDPEFERYANEHINQTDPGHRGSSRYSGLESKWRESKQQQYLRELAKSAAAVEAKRSG